jgi:hypothetical protein
MPLTVEVGHGIGASAPVQFALAVSIENFPEHMPTAMAAQIGPSIPVHPVLPQPKIVFPIAADLQRQYVALPSLMPLTARGRRQDGIRAPAPVQFAPAALIENFPEHVPAMAAQIEPPIPLPPVLP